MKEVKIGLIGFGVVGEGVYTALLKSAHLRASVAKIVVKDPQKKRSAPSELFTLDVNQVLNSEEIDLIIELTDDSEFALKICLQAFAKGKSVISANKKMIAQYHHELIAAAQSNEVCFLYEGAVGGSIPIIRNLEDYFRKECVLNITGIINGSTNFILSGMQDGGLGFEEVLKLAQEKGFAESNPHLDVSGEDARNKLQILIYHTYGVHLPASNIPTFGITKITSEDIHFARSCNCSIKLIARCVKHEDGLEVFVGPEFIQKSEDLAGINGSLNAICVEGEFSGQQYLQGHGAGRYPTTSAVLADVLAYSNNYSYSHSKQEASNVDSVRTKKFFYVRHSRQDSLKLKRKFKIVRTLEAKSKKESRHIILADPIELAQWSLTNECSTIQLNENGMKARILANDTKKEELCYMG